MSERNRLRKAVGQVASGYLLIHLNINLGTLDILPDWAGYLLICQALAGLTREDESAGLLKPLGLVLAVWHGIKWVADIVGASIDINILSIVATVVSLYFHFQLLTNLAGIAAAFDCPQRGALLGLRTVRTVVDTVLQIIVYMGSFEKESWQAVLLILGVVQLVVLIWLCAELFGLKKALLSADDGAHL